MIVWMQLEKFARDMRDNLYNPINIQLPKKGNHAYYVQQMSSKQTPFGDNDPISVMIAQDIMGKEVNKTGTREITGYVNNTIKTDVIKLLDKRLQQGLPVDGAFRLSLRNASFFDNSNNISGIKVEYIDKDEL